MWRKEEEGWNLYRVRCSWGPVAQVCESERRDDGTRKSRRFFAPFLADKQILYHAPCKGLQRHPNTFSTVRTAVSWGPGRPKPVLMCATEGSGAPEEGKDA